jgi:hypothetical protein
VTCFQADQTQRSGGNTSYHDRGEGRLLFYLEKLIFSRVGARREKKGE